MKTKHYQSEEEILRAIDRTAANKAKWAERAEAWDNHADQLYREAAKLTGLDAFQGS